MTMLVSLCAVAKTPADIKSDLIQNMVKDGYLSQKMADTVAQRYITEQDKQEASQLAQSDTKEQSSWSKYLSWINVIKVIAICLLLIAFSGFIKLAIKKMWHLIVAVPTWIYQAFFMSLTLYGTLYPQNIWSTQAFYVVLFCAFANIIIMGWIIITYEKQLVPIINKLCLGVPAATVASFWAMIYFAVLAIAYESQVFGFFAAVCLSGVLSFTLIYTPGTLFLYFKENMLSSVVLGHLLVLAAYIITWKTGVAPEPIKYFHAGLQYYCTIAMCTGLLVGASPFYRRSNALYAVLFVALVAAATMGYFFLDLTVICTIIMCFGVLFALEWIGFWGFHGGLVLGTFRKIWCNCD